MSRFTEILFHPGREPGVDFKRYSVYTIVANGIRDTIMNKDADLEVTLFCDGGPGTPGFAMEAVINALSIAGFRPVPADEE
jgi:hypothetical protein